MRPRSTLAIFFFISAVIATLPSPLICEEPIDNQPPYSSDTIPCILGCDVPVAVATGSLLPGSINETNIPYCQLNCVRKDATPSQSAAAPGCSSVCANGHSGNPEELGWCMYWCVDGYRDVVVSTTCVPHIGYVTVTTVIGGVTETAPILTEPAAWSSWYETQTVLPKPTTVGDDASSTSGPTTTTPTPTSTKGESLFSSNSASTGQTTEITVTSTSSLTAGADEQTAITTSAKGAANAIYPGAMGLVTFLCGLIIL